MRRKKLIYAALAAAAVLLVIITAAIHMKLAKGHTEENNAEHQPDSTVNENVILSVAQKITAEEAKDIMDSGEKLFLLDVRTQDEYDAEHIPGAVCIPDYKLTESRAELPQDYDALILVYCRSGRRSAASATALAGMGYRNVKDFGGIIDWPFETVLQTESTDEKQTDGEHEHKWEAYDCNYQQCSICGAQKRYME